MIKLEKQLEDLECEVYEIGDKVSHQKHGKGEVVKMSFDFFCDFNDSAYALKYAVQFDNKRVECGHNELSPL